MPEVIRIAMIIHGYHPRIGGAERLLASLTPLLQAQDLEVHILTRRYPGLAAFEMVDGVPVHRLPIPGPKPIASLSFTLAALPLLRRLRPHVLHAHEFFSPTTTAIVAQQLFGTPVVVTAHRSGELGDVQRLQQKTLGTRRIAIFRQRVNAFTAISQEIDTELAQIGIPQQRRLFIPNGVATDRFEPLAPEEKRAVRSSLDLPDAPMVIFTGRLAAEKRLDQLIAIWPAVRTVHPDAQLLLLGKGDEEKALRQAAGAGVRFLGRVEDVVPYLQAADLFVLPSIAEGLSIALLEAMSTGLPTLATAVGGAPDLIDHGETGWLIPPNEPLALQGAVLTLLGDPGLRIHLGRRGRERVARDYTLPAIAMRWRALYDQLLNVN